MKEITINLNGAARRVAVAPNETLLDVLRGKLGIKTPKEGCGRGDCGACTVLLDGKVVVVVECNPKFGPAAFAAIEKYGVTEGISYISTGGGAFLEFVAGKTLPAVAALEARALR